MEINGTVLYRCLRFARAFPNFAARQHLTWAQYRMLSPETDTPEGQAAKKFVEALVNRSAAVTITTTNLDKWDRYLSDVFLETKSGEEIFLNNRLLENGDDAKADVVVPPLRFKSETEGRAARPAFIGPATAAAHPGHAPRFAFRS